jgi:hypothetical protein
MMAADVTFSGEEGGNESALKSWFNTYKSVTTL